MGFSKRLWEESMQKGYTAPEGVFVCGECVRNEILKAVLDDAATAQKCSYCASATAAPIRVLLNEISDAAFAGYTDPANELPFESREGGYQGEVLHSRELIDDLGDWTNSDVLFEDVCHAFSGSFWCRANYFGVDAKSRLRYGWDDFVGQVKHKTRYLFLQEEREDDDYRESIPPSRMLDEVGGLLNTLVKRIPKGLLTYRARVVKASDHPQTAGELGTPPAELARLDNRMSPAGIPMFYAALDKDTAVVETFDPQMGCERKIAVGRWRAMRELVVLDLTELPEMPDPFDSVSRADGPRVSFVYEFVHEFTKPVDRATSSIDYVPTQVVTEYVRHRMTSESSGIDAIKYRSSKCVDGVAVVVFAERDNCLGSEEREWHHDEQLLELCDVHYHDPMEFEHLWESPDEG